MSKRRTLIITGAAGGLGTALCMHFAHEYHLLALDRVPDQDLSNKLKDLITTGEVEYHCIDCTDERAVIRLRESIEHEDLYLSGMVLAAAIMPISSFEQTSLELWRHTLDVNLTSPFIMCQQFVSLLKESSSIVMVGSVLGTVAAYDLMAYSTSKAALQHLAQNLALELLPRGISVNCICPGFMNTPMYQTAVRNSSLNTNWYHLLEGIPQKVVVIQEVVQAIDYMIRQKGMTGQAMIIDGGYSIR
ncbi:SDR family NAD(P)-dependent oxidoreductase [Paenibacillus pseudetheri]|uniref:Ketoreductase domain-containing protein n=1 Tax=Paenibacillus pseudetheri TaxID=2897682 RepID=A0ABM9BII4_9BACL|nr:SDR family oxidoreductase [Paenibacillus pseudetheri]CAH1058190.1 hypothetical protein PAECIP111894_04363 [Paenibacillus pseudetheri]